MSSRLLYAEDFHEIQAHFAARPCGISLVIPFDVSTLDLTATPSRVHRRLQCTRGVRRTLSAASAWMLILLAASPVTAPFSTCSLSDLMSAARTHAVTWTAAHQPTVESIEASAPQGTPGSILDEEQFKDGAALSDTPVSAPASSRAEAASRPQPHDTAIRSTLVALRL
jgi:hypothetical protein